MRNEKSRDRKTRDVSRSYRVEDGARFRLKDHDPGETRGVRSRKEADAWRERGVRRMADLQEKLYAQNRWAVLIILQGMDAAGKDGVVGHVMTGVNPQGCRVSSFKQPSVEELQHDFLWRAALRLPERGQIGIFNRSYYEELLVVRVHPDLLEREKIPQPLLSKRIWKERFEDIVGWERHLGRNGVLIRKFFLHMSHDEQKKRFLKRLDRPEKNWKFSLSDVREREHWDEYMAAYEDAIRHTASPEAPWYVVPADKKWFTRLVVAEAIVDALDSLDLAFPKLDATALAELRAARALLERKGSERSRRTSKSSGD